jgi:hypothetical protein
MIPILIGGQLNFSLFINIVNIYNKKIIFTSKKACKTSFFLTTVILFGGDNWVRTSDPLHVEQVL